MTKHSNKALIRVGVCIGFITRVFAQSDKFEPGLAVNLVNDAGISEKILVEAQDHVRRIFKSAGIRIEWNSGDGLPVTVVLASRTTEIKFGRRMAHKFGFAVGNNGRQPRRAYVFAGRVNELTWVRNRLGMHTGFTIPEDRTSMLHRKTAEASLLGHVIAHEIGHLILPHGSHSKEGIMSPQIDNRDFRLAGTGDLLFSNAQSELMRGNLIPALAMEQ